MAVKQQDVINFISIFHDKIEEHSHALTMFDQAIGDGDHGINMKRGMGAVMDKAESFTDAPISEIFKIVGNTLVGTVGGASGPLYGTAFKKAGVACKDKEELTAEDVSEAIQAAIEGIIKRGKATTGEKTMLDAIIPAKEAYDKAIAEGKTITEAFAEAEAVAWEGVEYTKTIIATKGRASYVGERSIGHQDPGATSITYLLQAAKEAGQKAE